MRQFLDGNGNDQTVAVVNAMQQGNFRLKTLYLIGEPESPYSFWLTDWDTSLTWNLWGTFHPAVVKRGKIVSEAGLKVQSTELIWSPPVGNFTSVLADTSPYQQVRLGWFDNLPVRMWTCFMLKPGDVNTFGAMELFGGRIGDATFQRGQITFTVNCWLDTLDQNIPAALIEAANTVASFGGAKPPAGFSAIPYFDTVTGSTASLIIGDCTTPSAGYLFPANSLQNGFLVFQDGPGATLAGRFSAIAGNQAVSSHNNIQLYSLMPWAPTPGVDTFYVSAAWPYNQADGSYYGFPFVPDPTTAI